MSASAIVAATIGAIAIATTFCLLGAIMAYPREGAGPVADGRDAGI